MKEKKLVAPAVITTFLVLWFFGYLALCLLVPMPVFFKVVGCLVFLALISVSIYVLTERIKEIRSGEEDDLGNY